MGRTPTYPLILSLFLWIGNAYGQPCSIDLGPDHLICQGQTVTLTAPAGFPNYLWSTGSTAASITVGTAGTYWGEASYPSGNLSVNGNFSAGNTGFTTQFNYNSTLVTENNYWVATNAALFHPMFIGTGNGQYLMVNAGPSSPGMRFWCQTVPVCPGQTYTLSYRAVSLASQNPPRLTMFVNNEWTFQDHVLNVPQNSWQTYNTTWTAAAGVTSAEFCLVVSSGWGVGNDFGIDDITIQSTVVLRDYVDVAVTPLPVVDLGPDVNLCTGQNLTLDAGVAGGSYVWQDGSTASTYVVTGPGNYSVTVTANGCPATDAITVTYSAPPVVDLGPDLALCTGQSITLDASTAGATYGWQDGSIGPTLNVTTPGTYSVNVSANGCSASDAVDITFNPTPVVDIGTDQTVCAGDQVVLDATTPGATYVWQDGSTGPTFTATTNGLYGPLVTVNGCTGADFVNINFTPLPVVDLGPDQTVCPGEAVVLDATVPGGTYVWQDGSTGPTFSATTPGIYTVQVTANNCPSSDAFTLSNFSLQTVDLGPDIFFCQGQSATIGAVVPGATYLWSTGEATPTIGVSTAGIAWVDVTLNGCVVRDSIEVFVTPLPVVDLGADQTVCPGNLVTLDATTPSATYAWDTGASAATIDVGVGTFAVTVTANGCSSTDAITVNNFAAALVDLGADETLCPGTQLVLDATQPGATYVWQDGSLAPTFTVTVDGTYDITLTDANGCVATDVIYVTYAAPTPIDLGPDTTLCAGSTITLDATTPGASYLWNNGAVTPTISVASLGNYSVTVTQGTCIVSDAIDVQVAALPAVSLGNDTTLCPGEQLLLDATGSGLTYDWSTGAVSGSIIASTAGNYEVTVTNTANCTATDAVVVAFASPSAVDLGANVVLCQGEDVVFDATLPGASYVWSSGASSPTLTVSVPGVVWVEVTQGVCNVSDTVVVTVNPMPQVALGNDVTLCAGENILLDATWPGATYLWNTGAVTATLTAAATGTYSVDVDLNGCVASDAILVNVLSATSLDLGPDVSLCAGEQVILDATTPGSTYMWNTGATSATLSVSTSGTYWAEVSTGLCSVSDTVVVTVNPMPQVALGNDVTLCADEDILLDATWPGATYLWNTGAVTATLTAATTGTYSVDVDLNGCVASDAILVNVLSATSLDLGPDVSLCAGEQVILDATTPGSTYVWNTGATSATLTVAASGTYWAEVSTGLCSVSDTIVVIVNPMPQVALGNDVTLCAGEDILLDATWPGATYLWNTGAVTATLNAAATGTYSVDVDLNGCMASDAILVNVLSATSLGLGPDVSLCAGEQVVLDATTPGSTYLWSTGATSATLTVATSGTYWAEVSTGLCSVSDTVVVIVNPMPQVALGNDVTLCAGEDILLDATWPGATYLWNTGAVTATLTASTTGTYSVDVDLNGCAASDAILVTVLTANAIDLEADLVGCDGDEFVLDATVPGSTYLWSTGASSATISISASGTYWVDVSQNGCSVSDTISVLLNETPVVDLGPDLTFCDGEPSATLDATWPGASYLWSTASTTPSIAISTSGTYSVEVDLNGCVATDEVSVTFGSVSYSLGPDTVLCPGETLLLEVPLGNGTVIWNDEQNGPSFTVTTSGTYWMVFTGGSGCNTTDTITVDYSTPGMIDLGPDLSLCDGESHELDATLSNAVILWEDGSSDPLRTVTASGTYSVNATVGQCVVADAIDITFNPLPVVDLGPDASLCPGSTALFDATLPGASYLWQNGATTPTLNAATAGSVSVIVTVNGCSTSDEALVTVLEGPDPELGGDLVLCEGSTMQLDASENGASYVWNDGSSSPDRIVAAEGIYWVDVTRNNCTVRDSILVSVFDPNTLDLGADRLICSGSTTVLDATVQGASYLWSTGAVSPSISVTTAGSYSVEITVSGCTAQDAVSIDLLTLDTPDLGPDISLCDGSSTELAVVANGASVLWSTGATSNMITVTEAGSYSVTLDSLGCTTSDAVLVSISPMTSEIDLGPSRSLCAGVHDVVEAPLIPGATYLWNTGATGPALSIDAPGIYSVTATGQCIDAQASIEITVGDCGTYVFVPNGFTPNGDGFNDIFLPSIAGPVDRFQLDIFDRWGELIHTTTDRDAGWDGVYNGTNSQDGVYVWTLMYRVLGPDGVKAERLTGHVTLLR